MTNQYKKTLKPSILASTIAVLLAGAWLPLKAQEGPVLEGPVIEEVQITGSRIVRRDATANSPIMTLEEGRFQESSTIAMESVLNQLPQFVPAVTQFEAVPVGQLSNTGSANITPTAATVSLRGLGANRNLVLVNGRRAMPVDAGMAVDINSIPSAAVARVETITGGASSVYGADAVAGVVNFILKDNFEGMDFGYQYGLTEQGDGEEQSLSVVMGATFGQSGHLMIGLERYQRGKVLQKDRDFYTQGWADTGSQGGINVFYTAPYAANAVANPFNQTVVDALFGAGAVNTRSGGNYYLNNDGTVYRTQAGGNFRYSGPTTTTEGSIYRFIRGDTGSLAENWVDYQESNPLNRQSFFGNAGIEITDKLNAFAQGDFSSSSGTSLGRVSGLIGGWGGTVPHGNGLYAPSLLADGLTTNPDYLPGGRFGLNCGPTGGCSKSQVWPKSPEMQRLLDSRPNPEAPVTMGMASTWAGVVRNNVDVRTYQIVLGLDGKLPGRGWTWEAYVSTGSSITTNESLGVSSVERWRYLINQPNYGTGLYQRGNEPGNGFGAGSMTCTSGFTALGQGERYYLESTGYQSTLPSADCQLAIGADMAATSNMEQTVYEANLQGSLLQLPAGDLGFAAGVSYRKNDYRYLPPVLQAPESIFDLPSGMYPRSQTRGKISTAEIYGELLVPVIAGVSGIEHLDLELGYRYSDNNPTQAVSSWKSLADWKINDAVRFRGGYQVANRAPNIAELFQSPDLFLYVRSKGDWCSDLNPANAAAPNPKLNPNAAQARALCEALMGPQGAATYYNNPDRPATSNQNYFSYIKGNPTLKEETAKTITLGIVADLTRDLSLSVDWWNIKIDNMISTEDPDNIYALCMSPENNPAFDPSTVACSKINRAVDTGAEGNTLLLYTNQGAIDFAGYDIALNWKKELGPGLLNFNTNLTLTDKALTQTAPEMPFNDWKGTSGPADLIGLNGYAYDWRSAVNATYTIEQWSASLRWRHLPSIKSLATGTPGNTDVPTNAYDLLDFSGRYNLSKTISLRFGIDNLLDRAPERVFPNATNTATGQTNRNFYDILGRRYYLGVNLHF